MKLDDLNLTDATTEITISKTSLTQNTGSVLKKLGSIYDEHAKLVFCFDVSGSMNERVARDKNGAIATEQYIWSNLADIRKSYANALDRHFAGCPDWNDTNILKLTDGEDVDGKPACPMSDEALKIAVVEKDLIDSFGVRPDFSKKHLMPPTRIELVQKLAVQEVKARFEKYPKNKLAVVPFGAGAKVSIDGGTQDQVIEVCERVAVGMDGVNSGGTDIMASIRCAIECCRKNPSSVGLHHFVIVSDGQDAGTNVLPEWIPTLKASGVVLDYIHIGDESYTNNDLKQACKELGGEYVCVNTAKDFETKFVEAARRLMLPAPAEK